MPHDETESGGPAAAGRWWENRTGSQDPTGPLPRATENPGAPDTAPSAPDPTVEVGLPTGATPVGAPAGGSGAPGGVPTDDPWGTPAAPGAPAVWSPPAPAGPTATWPPPPQPGWGTHQPQWATVAEERWGTPSPGPAQWGPPGGSSWGAAPAPGWSGGQGAPTLTHPNPPTAPWAAGAPWAHPTHPPPSPPQGTWPGGPWQQPPWNPPPPRQRTPEERRRIRRYGFAFVVVLLLALGIGIGIGAAVAPTRPATSTTSAKQLVAKAVAAATKARTYHYVQLSTQAGAHYDIVGDAAPDGGRQVITQKGASGTDVYDLRLVKGAVYFRGNAEADVDQLGVSSTTTDALAGKWVKVVKGDGPYTKFADGIATKSNISQINATFVAASVRSMPGSKPTTTRIVGGLYAGKGKAPVGAADLVVVQSTSLPQSLNGDLTAGTRGSLRLTWTFTHYGEKVTVKAPSGAVAFSSLNTHPTTTGTTKGTTKSSKG